MSKSHFTNHWVLDFSRRCERFHVGALGIRAKNELKGRALSNLLQHAGALGGFSI